MDVARRCTDNWKSRGSDSRLIIMALRNSMVAIQPSMGKVFGMYFSVIELVFGTIPVIGCSLETSVLKELSL